ncbi:MAG: Sec-independent protein translocase subunit TatA [Marmoricola sp.]
MRDIGPTEIILILAVIILLFGAKKLPELARGSGRALRIFKAETKGLMDEDDEAAAKPLSAGEATEARPAEARPAESEQQPKPVD